ncbi:MAG: peptidoglycan-binding domain-containing protein, partial [Patescibacteria group bacterium]
GKTLAAVQTQPSTAIQTQIQPLIQTISAGTSKLIGPFAIYSSINSDQVKLLQSMLAKNKDIYPEGIITGYYGELTIKAVKRFQIKYNIEPIGIAGPKTRIKINEIFGQ